MLFVAIATNLKYNENGDLDMTSKRQSLVVEIYNAIQKYHFTKSETYQDGQIITNFIEKRNRIYFLKSGQADLIRFSKNGDEELVDHFVKADIFGEMFYEIYHNSDLSIIARTTCEVFYFHYDDFVFNTRRSKDYQLVQQNLFRLLSYKVVSLNSHIEILNKHSIREKLLSYFDQLATKNLSKNIYIPFSWTELASYLNINRSAMTRELKNLEEEGFITRSGNKIQIHY